MSTLGPDQSQQAALTGKQLALIVYILYLVAYFTGITAVIGVIIAHVQIGSADPLLASHYRFQIRTFWIGVVYRDWNNPDHGVDRHCRAVLVVHLVAGAQHQGRARLEREQADRQSGLMAVRVSGPAN
jgi:hypothetical protein